MFLPNQRKCASILSALAIGAISGCGLSSDQRVLSVDLGIPVRPPQSSSTLSPRAHSLMSVTATGECLQDQIFLLSRNIKNGKTIDLKKLPVRSKIVTGGPTVSYDATPGDINNLITYLKDYSSLDSEPTIAAPRTEKIEVGIIGQFVKPQDFNNDGICDNTLPSNSNVWMNNPELNTARFGHASSVLPDGSILVSGGMTTTPANAPIATSERFDPSTRIWTNEGSMSTARYDHTSTVLSDGRVVVIGGKSTYSTTVGTPIQPVLTNPIEIYTPGSDAAVSWSAPTVPTSFNANIHSHTATLLPGDQILVIGGNMLGNYSSDQAGIYDPTQNSWTPLPPLPNARESHATVIVNNKVVVAGGKKNQGSTSYPNIIQVLDLANPSNWSNSNGTYSRVGMTATAYGNQVLLIGGETTYGMPAPTSGAQLFNPNNLDFETSLPSLTIALSDHRTILLPDKRILVMSTSGTQIYRPSISGPTVTWAWGIGTAMNTSGRTNFTAHAMNDGTVVMIGGKLSSALKSSETFVPMIQSLNTSSVVGHTTVDPSSLLGDSVSLSLQVLHSNLTSGTYSLDAFPKKNDWMSISSSFSPSQCQFGSNSPSSCTGFTAYVSGVRYFKNDEDLLVKTPLKTSIAAAPYPSSLYYLPHSKEMEVVFDVYNTTSCISTGNAQGFCGRYKANLNQIAPYSVTATLIQNYYSTNSTPTTIQGLITRNLP